MSQIAVFGLGRFGHHVVRELSSRGHEVLAVDNDERKVRRVRDFSSQAVVLDVREKDRVEALGVSSFDTVVISLGQLVEVSSLLALHLKDIGGPHVICKAGSEDHARLLERIGVDEVVFPEKEAAIRLARQLSNRNLLDFVTLGDTHSIEEIAPPNDFYGKTFAELDLRNRYGIQVVGTRDALTGAVNLSPAGDTRILDSHSLIVLGENKDLERFEQR